MDGEGNFSVHIVEYEIRNQMETVSVEPPRLPTSEWEQSRAILGANRTGGFSFGQ